MNIMCVVLHQKHEKKSTKVSFWSVLLKMLLLMLLDEMVALVLKQRIKHL